jgi:uncharacterized membrane protein
MRIVSGLSHAFLAFAVALTCAGCGGTGTPGGPGAKTGGDNKTTLGGPAEETFTINVPGSTTLKQGESKVVRLALKRGKNFGEDVSLKLEDLPKGVTSDPSSPKIAKSETEVQVTLKAASDAAVGDFTVKVVGQPSHGKQATNTLKLTVQKPNS